MELRKQLSVLKRHRWLIVEAMVLAALIGGFVAHNRKPHYQATASVLLLATVPSQGPSALPSPASNSEYSVVEAQLVTGPQVASAAARDLHASDPSALAAQVKVGGTDILDVSATDPNPARAVRIANAFAEEFVSVSRLQTVTALQSAVNNLTARLTQLETQLTPTELNALHSSTPTATQSAAAIEFQDLYSQQQQLLVQENLTQGPGQVIAPARSAARVETSVKNILLLAGLGGLAVGLGGAFLREQLDDRLRSREDVEQAGFGLPIAAEVPLDRRAVRRARRKTLADGLNSTLAEASRAMRISLEFLGVRRDLRSVLVTSAGLGEGKTLIAGLLALAYANAGYRTVLVEADLRAPDLAERFGVGNPNRGLTDALVDVDRHMDNGWGLAHMEDLLLSTPVSNLYLLPAGRLPPNPAELLSSSRMREVLHQLAETHDVCIVDAAPLLPIADTRPLAEMVDGVLLVVSLGHSNRRSVHQAVGALEGATVNWLGLVVNQSVRPRRMAEPGRRYRAPASPTFSAQDERLHRVGTPSTSGRGGWSVVRGRHARSHAPRWRVVGSRASGNGARTKAGTAPVPESSADRPEPK
jgi:capsular exopolysaccharide synthesis family protein